MLAPTGFSFPLASGVPTIYTIGSPVSVSPALTGVVTNCTASPSLPAGLVLNTTNCSITGTPTTATGATSYTITASNGAGSVNTVVQIQINNVPPSNLVYPFGTSTVLPIGTAQSITPTITGGVTSCSSSPSLPTGLIINATTCTISGTPTVVRVATNYTFTASNSFGSTNVILSIAATLFAPTNLNYPFAGNAVVYTQGNAVDVLPTVSGIVTTCSSSPALPAGLSLTVTTCRISGIPSAETVTRNYTITASNSAGGTNRVVFITVNLPPPSNLVYPKNGDLTYFINIPRTRTPSLLGTISSCVSSPALPEGLSINQTNCAISGTATVEQASQLYTITASNSGGSTTAAIRIKIEKLLPPTMVLPSGHYNTPQNNILSIHQDDDEIVIRCEINGYEPNSNSEIFTIPVHIYSARGTGFKCKTFIGAYSSVLTSATRDYSYPPIKTGQTTSNTACYDGSIQSGVARGYTENDNGTVTDTYSGLFRQRCLIGQINDSSCSGTVTLVNWYDAKDYCSNLTLANKTWRMPDINELLDLEDYNTRRSFVNVNQSIFPNSMNLQNFAFYYWSSNNYAYNVDHALTTLALYGLHKISEVLSGRQITVRCVSGTTTSSHQFFVDNGDGTVQDKKTGLLWQKTLSFYSPRTDDLPAMVNLCSTSHLAGKTWRAPNINELRSIIDFSIVAHVNNPTFFAGEGSHYSSTGNHCPYGSGNVRYIFTDCDTFAYVRCVSGP